MNNLHTCSQRICPKDCWHIRVSEKCPYLCLSISLFFFYHSILMMASRHRGLIF
ncbi:hypothetical protein METBIDRAFT_98496 [Metschnikowia bicuspidata var. bicuspidata NRRL YB-4993]|uniref:Uncharacterized protein n=1 Tax=Metschnikowia bicuspidata var. bicuspidata NRRL YB-4993 TaxID=869754 RepID=A0A1A0HFZ3_9ASCO|nr:hypothetical protein METBIDRAFT_98496 [Metschnikowia bicuspidata var. bicuspidata NRRL YB-4993]OBA23079.1 hypothetical protein METBIDRAFT_98496 [Metschnikowia bicuspidata var. bicuspidata NRRL YB-4993]